MMNVAHKLLAHVRTRIREALRRIHPSPILVLGNQKSGTTAIAGLLAEATNLSVTLDLPGMYEPTQTRLHNGDLSFDQFVQNNAQDFARDIVKEPSLTFLYSDLRARFPDSSFVFIVRDPRDNIRSILDRLSLPGDYTALPDKELQAISPEWRLILDGTWMGLEGENYIDLLAERWKRAAAIYRENRDAMDLVRFEDFLDDKVRVICRLAETLDLEPVRDISDKVDVQFQPRGNRDVSWLEFFGAHNLRRIERICCHEMAELGYATST